MAAVPSAAVAAVPSAAVVLGVGTPTPMVASNPGAAGTIGLLLEKEFQEDRVDTVMLCYTRLSRYYLFGASRVSLCFCVVLLLLVSPAWFPGGAATSLSDVVEYPWK